MHDWDMGMRTHLTALARSLTLGLVGAWFSAPAALAQTPSFTLVGVPADFPPSATSGVRALSADGRSAAGSTAGLGQPGFLWTTTGGRNDFGRTAGPGISPGLGISGDGLTVVGVAGITTYHAYRWSAAGGYSDMGTLAGYSQSEAHDANHDGSIIVGTLSNGQGSTPQAFRWTQTGGMQGLGAGTTAQAISRDGGTIVGNFGTAPDGFRWTPLGGMEFLPSLGGIGSARVSGVNFDGSIVVGNSGADFHPTMWLNGSPIDLMPGGNVGVFLSAGGVNDTGTVVVGQATTSTFQLTAGVWTALTGIVPLSDYLTSNGVAVPSGLELAHCTAVSSDGMTFAGYTANGPFGVQGFIATIPPPCPSDLDNDGSLQNGGTRDHAVTIDDLLFFLSAFEVGDLSADLDNGSSTGTHDNAVDINDLLFFLARFEQGC
jgi:uncharacterized membrane protein